MTIPRDMLDRSRATPGCRFCGGWGLGYYGAACLQCPSEAKRLADAEYERQQAWKAKKWTPQEATSVVQMLRGVVGQFGQPFSEEEIWSWLDKQGKIAWPEPLWTVHSGNEEEWAVLVAVFHRERVEEAMTAAQGDPTEFNRIVRERLAQVLERQRMAQAQDVTQEEVHGTQDPLTTS